MIPVRLSAPFVLIIAVASIGVSLFRSWMAGNAREMDHRLPPRPRAWQDDDGVDFHGDAFDRASGRA